MSLETPFPFFISILLTSEDLCERLDEENFWLRFDDDFLTSLDFLWMSLTTPVKMNKIS